MKTITVGPFLRPADIVEIMDYSERSAYNVIRDLNAELRKKGAYTRAGRVSTQYFCERFHIDPATLGINMDERSEKNAV